ncbi:MAG: phage portal protein [Planctomycetaceae bacterium]|nr:phage portal protein [Planctomycetaceae bacterium]
MLSFLRNLFHTRTWYPLSQVPSGFFTPTRNPGSICSAEQALTLAPFFAAVRLYSTQLGSLPLVTYKQTPSGREHAVLHPAYNLLLKRPNPAQSRAVFMQYIAKELFLHGNAYVLIRWRNNGSPYALYPCPNGAVSRVIVDSEWNKQYEINFGTGAEWHDDSDVIHLMGHSTDGLQGEPVWKYAAESLGLHRQVLEAANNFFNNSVRPSVYIKYPGKISKEADANLKIWLAEQAGGTINTGKPFWLTDGGEVSNINTTTAEDSQIIQGLGASVGDIGRWTGLSPIQLGDFSAAHYNSLSADNTFLYQRSLRPLLDSIEQEINYKLFVDGNTFCEFDTDEILRGDPLTQAQIANIGIQGGWILRSEAREWGGLPPIEGLDTPLQPLNMGTPQPQPGAATPQQPGVTANA